MSDFSSRFVRMQVYADLEIKPVIIIAVIFLFTAVMDIITQIFLPDILKAAGVEVINLPKSSMTTVFQNVWGDFLTTGTLVVIYYGSTAFSSDINNDRSIYFYLSHPVTKRTYFIDRSLIKMGMVFVVCVLASLTTFLITSLFYHPISIIRIIVGSMVIGLGLVSILGVVLMFNSKFSTSSSIGLGLGFFIIMGLVQYLSSFVSWFSWLSPMALTHIWVKILVGNYHDFIGHVLGILGWALFSMIIGIKSFNSRDI